MNLSINKDQLNKISNHLSKHNIAFQKVYNGDRPDRQPVHTVYGGANLFDANIAYKLAEGARKNLAYYAPNFCILGRLLQLDGWQSLPEDVEEVKTLQNRLDNLSEEQRKKETHWLAYTVYNKLVNKLNTEALEDFRIDFEDGFGNILVVLGAQC